MAAKIKKGDNVVVLTGRDKGKAGTVAQVLPKENRVVVQGVNLVKRHTAPKPGNPGGIVEKEASLHLSNVELYRMGQTNVRGRYPVHFHMMGEASGRASVRRLVSTA